MKNDLICPSVIKIAVISIIWAFLLTFSLKVWAVENGPADFEALYSSDLSVLPDTDVPPVPALSDKRYGVPYSLRGVLTRYEDKVAFNTPDGRVFELEISGRKARAFNGKTVEIYAKAQAADDLAVLKVERIAEYVPGAEEVVAPYVSRSRPARIASETGDVMVMENIRWNRDRISPDNFDWATVTVRPELLKNVYFVKKPFAPEWIAAHSFFVFTFEDGGLVDAAGRKTDALVLTIEAYLKEGEQYSLTEGFKDKFGIVWQLTTWDDYSFRSIDLEKHRLIPYPLILDRQSRVALLKESLRQAAVNRGGEFYHTITNNCTNNLVILVNRVLPESRRLRLWSIPYLVYNLRATMPVWVPAYLQKKGLLGAQLPELNSGNSSSILP